jgi:class 3 adenylate cyclase
LVMTDIVDSTRSWAQHERDMAHDLEAHDRAVRHVVADLGGSVFKHTGDGAIAAFADPAAAVLAAAEIPTDDERFGLAYARRFAAAGRRQHRCRCRARRRSVRDGGQPGGPARRLVPAGGGAGGELDEQLGHRRVAGRG